MIGRANCLNVFFFLRIENIFNPLTELSDGKHSSQTIGKIFLKTGIIKIHLVASVF